MASRTWPQDFGDVEQRPLVPVQLVKSAASFVLVVLALALSYEPGRAGLVYVTGYACVRFSLEVVGGDPVRPFAYGLSEAQWSSLFVLAVATIVRAEWWTIAALAGVGTATAWLVIRRRARELFLPPHLRELDHELAQVIADRKQRTTRLGVAASCADLPDGRRDWILSSARPEWSVDAARRLAHALWPNVEIVEGRTPGVVHVIES